MSDLVEFLRARLDEDESEAAVALIMRRLPNHHATSGPIYDPARVLADVKAKRKIVDMFRPSDQTSYEPGVIGYWSAVDRTLRRLAEVYADHEDYDQEWTP